MPVLTGLGAKAPFADWRSDMLSGADRRFSGPSGFFLPGAVLGFDFMVTYNQAVTRTMIEESDVVLVWIDARTAYDLTIWRDALAAHEAGVLTILGVDETFDGELYGLPTIASMTVRASTPTEAFSKARRFVIDTLYTQARPTPPELAFWCAAMENDAPELADLVPEFEMRFPSTKGRSTVRRFDFAVPSRKLLIEIDGAGHNDNLADQNDRLKTEFAEKYGYSVMRFRSSPMMSDPNSKVAEVIDRISRTPVRSDNFLKTRIMPNKALDGWPFGTFRQDGKPVVEKPRNEDVGDTSDIVIGVVPNRFVTEPEGLDAQRDLFRRIGERYGKSSTDMDEFFEWVDTTHLGDVRTWESARERRRLIINVDLYCQETLALSLADGTIVPHVEPYEATLVEIDVSRSWEEQCPANLWAALRHTIPVTDSDIEALYAAPEGVMTIPLATESGPRRMVSFMAGSTFDVDTAWEVAQWWNTSLDTPMRDFTLVVEKGRSSLRAAIGGLDLYPQFPHIGKASRWYKGDEGGSPVVWKNSLPLVRVTFQMGDETDMELVRMLANPDEYHP